MYFGGCGYHELSICQNKFGGSHGYSNVKELQIKKTFQVGVYRIFLILAAILVCGSEGLNFEGLCFLELKKRLNHQFNQFV